VHGNADATFTAKNAARCLYAWGAPSHVLVYPGASKPLIGPVKHDSEIHAVDGLGGVEGLPNSDHPEVRKRFALDKDGNPVRALEGMASIIRETWKQGTGEKVTIVSTGPTTNIGVSETSSARTKWRSAHSLVKSVIC